MTIAKVYYCPCTMIIPEESVTKTLEGKLLKRALNINYTNDEVDIKRFQSYWDGRFLDFYTNGGMFERGGDLDRFEACEMRLKLILLDIEWNGRSRSLSVAQFINANRKKQVLIDDEETYGGVTGATQWAAFMTNQNLKQIPNKLRLEFANPNDNSGLWELTEEKLSTLDSF